MTKDLFSQHRERLLEKEAPLAARMRPRTLDEFVGQEHIVGQGRLLRRAIQADQLSSLIFHGPPGTGKTTLARIIANTTRSHFVSLNAVLAGVKNIREAIEEAQKRRGERGQKSILFVDEVHRFNKSQQDALLPWVENGTILLIGATTENPFFEVNKALVSRSRIFQLNLLEKKDLGELIFAVLADKERGYGHRNVVVTPEAFEHFIEISNGDARTLYNALELAVETTPLIQDQVVITLEVAEESIQKKAVLYDKEGDAHFDTISAFIKSVRGSDPDAALYWLAKMDVAGEDPKFIFRRLLILASEDIGLADPNAITVVNSCAQAFERIGMPEGRFHLAQATLYLSSTPKSNSCLGYFDALKVVQTERDEAVPNHIKDSSRDQKSLGHGKGYLYPHSFRNHWVAQQYLPTSFQGRVFYQPNQEGWEGLQQQEILRKREAQMAVFLEQSEHFENWTFSPENKPLEQWLQRSLSQVGSRFETIRDEIFSQLPIQRHHLVLDLNAKSGLLTWESLRKVPEGRVYSCTFQEQEKKQLLEQADKLAELNQPLVWNATPETIVTQCPEKAPWEWVIGRDVLNQVLSPSDFFEQWKETTDSTVFLFAESSPAFSQKISTWLPSAFLKEKEWESFLRWEKKSLEQHPTQYRIEKCIQTARAEGWQVHVSKKNIAYPFCFSMIFLQRLLRVADGLETSGSISLASVCDQEELLFYHKELERQLLNKTFLWKTHVLMVRLQKDIT